MTITPHLFAAYLKCHTKCWLRQTGESASGMKRVARRFTCLLRPIVEPVDRVGLKSCCLRKHSATVERFYKELLADELRSEVAVKFRARFEKHREYLFTFLEHDGIPWNNNNAEHAVKPLAKLRHVFNGVTTEKGIQRYLILLSVCQTCKYMDVDFLDFLRSGEKDIHAFAESRRRRRSSRLSAPTSTP